MLTKVQQEWVDALLSGEFKQCRRRLRVKEYGLDQPTYCCLGVLTELAVRAEIIPEFLTGINMNEALHPTVQEWVGLTDCLGHFKSENGLSNSLANLNDQGLPFPVIARTIASDPKGLFKKE